MGNPFGDGPEARTAYEQEQAEARQEYNDYLDAVDTFDREYERELDRADHMLDQAKEDSLTKTEADMLDHFLARVTR